MQINIEKHNKITWKNNNLRGNKLANQWNKNQKQVL